MNHSEVMTIRFHLKILKPEMVTETYRSWFFDESVRQFILFSKNDISLQDLKNYADEKFKSEEALFFGIYSKEDSSHIGNIKFEPIDSTKKTAVMGVLVGDPRWRGRGVFQEVMDELAVKLSRLGLTSVWLGVEKENVSAVKAYEKAGFKIGTNSDLKSCGNDVIHMVRTL